MKILLTFLLVIAATLVQAQTLKFESGYWHCDTVITVSGTQAELFSKVRQHVAIIARSAQDVTQDLDPVAHSVTIKGWSWVSPKKPGGNSMERLWFTMVVQAKDNKVRTEFLQLTMDVPSLKNDRKYVLGEAMQLKFKERVQRTLNVLQQGLVAALTKDNNW